MKEIGQSLVQRILRKSGGNMVAKRLSYFLSVNDNLEELDWLYLFKMHISSSYHPEQLSPPILDKSSHKDFRLVELNLRGFRKYPLARKCTYSLQFTTPDSKEPCSCYFIGNNGTGKTSLFSAIQEICSDDMSAASNRKIAQTSFMPHAGANLVDIYGLIKTRSCDVEFQSPEISPMYNYRKFLRPFFCSDYDINMLTDSADVKKFIMGHTGYNFTYKLINRLEEIEKGCLDTIKNYKDDPQSLSDEAVESGNNQAFNKELAHDAFRYFVTFKCEKPNDNKLLKKLSSLIDNLHKQVEKPDQKNKNVADNLNWTVIKLGEIISRLTDEVARLRSLDLLCPIMEKEYMNIIRHGEEILKMSEDYINTDESDPEYFDMRMENSSIYNHLSLLTVENLNTLRLSYATLLRNLYDSIYDGEDNTDFCRSYLKKMDSCTDENEDAGKREEMPAKEKFELITTHIDQLRECIKELRTSLDICVKKSYKNAEYFCKEIMNKFNMEEEKLIVKSDDTGFIIEYSIDDHPMSPLLVLNSFRLRLLTLCMKISMAFTVMEMLNLSFPLVFDDVFYSSDFNNRERVNEFISNIYQIYRQLLGEEALPLQIIFFTHDEIVLESAVKGTKEVGESFISGRIFNYQEMEADCDYHNECRLSIIYDFKKP